MAVMVGGSVGWFSCGVAQVSYQRDEYRLEDVVRQQTDNQNCLEWAEEEERKWGGKNKMAIQRKKDHTG